MLRGLTLIVVGLTLSAAAEAQVIETFNGHTSGTVVSGALPQGGTAPGTVFPGLTISCTNNGSGPNTCIVLDSSNPPGGAKDLGTPHRDFGGSGRGNGGRRGRSGENNRSMGNVLIVSQYLTDANADNVVDTTIDEPGGGVLDLAFTDLVVVHEVTLIDVDPSSFTFTMEPGFVLRFQASATNNSNNAAHRIDLSSYGFLTALQLELSSGGALAEVSYTPQVTPTQHTTWGEIKSGFGPKE